MKTPARKRGATTEARRLLDLYLLPGRQAPATRTAYAADLGAWWRWRTGAPIPEGSSSPPPIPQRSLVAAVADLLADHASTTGELVRYRAALVAGAQLQPQTIRRRLAALLALLRLARQLGAVSWSVALGASRADASSDRTGPTPDQLAAVLRVAALGPPDLAARDLAALRLSWDLGLRRAELVGLDLADLDPRGRVTVRGKGGSISHLSLPPGARAALEPYLARRGLDPGPLLVPCDPAGRLVRPPRRLDAGSWWRHLAQLGQRAGLPGPLRPHGLRHGAATAALDAGAPLRAVQRWGRWASTDMVLRYDDQRADLAGQAATLAGGALDAASCGAPLPGARLPRQLGDFYPTPEWLANALVAALPGSGGGGPCLDPGAGTGALGRAVARRWPSCPIVAVELEGVRLAALPPEWERVAGDFLKWEPGRTFPLVVCNPPFSAWIAWAERCLQLRAAGGLVLVLGFSNILASRRRAAWWRAHPPAQILQVSRRPCYRAEGGNDPRETIGIVWGPHDPGGPPPAFTWLDLEAGR